MRTMTAAGDAGLLRSAAGTLKPFEQPRIVSVRRCSFNQHDFDDPQGSGDPPPRSVRASVEPHSINIVLIEKETTTDFSIIDPLAT
ncbi:hypothetical protein [Bradyrhizobium sp. CCBAU 11386]|uniref:hypothetical protein n=1 Tax=Bradyrhizobium sp. CCBAU 11386 TaxID=1630837 RepID=UPI0023046448|nr:hypothetical protein [Bradyrhizobium sp. CCBAU 11386]